VETQYVCAHGAGHAASAALCPGASWKQKAGGGQTEREPRALGACAWPPRPGHKDTRQLRLGGHHPTDKIQRVSGPPGRWTRNPPAAPAAVPAANLGPGTRSEPAPTTHGGYGRNTTGGCLADDPRVVPLRPRACGGRQWCWVWCAGARVQIHRRRNTTGPRCFEPGWL
jgi:hypothetical protein